MDIYHAIRTAQSLEQLEALQEPIHQAATRNEIDFKLAKKLYMAQKKKIRDREWGYRA